MPPVVLLSGRERLGLAIEQKLAAAGAEVAWLAAPQRGVQPSLQELAAGSVLILAADDDAGNVDLALAARRIRSDLPIVMRLFDLALTAYLKQTLQGVTILSMSAIAAPALADAAQRAMAAAQARSAGGTALKSETKSAGASKNRPRAARVGPDRVLLAALGGLAAVIMAATAFFARALEIGWVDALYFVFTTVTTVGYGDISLRNASAAAKLVGILLMFSGAAFLAVLFGLCTDWVVSRRLDVLRGHIRVRGRGHLVIAGGGNVGFRVAGLLGERGHRVVVIERDPESRHVAALRAAGHSVIIADATSDAILDLANVDDAGAVIALTDSDAVNLQVALLVRSRRNDLPVVMRLVSPELSEHVSERRDALAISAMAVAAQEFAAAALAACGAESKQMASGI